LVAAFAGKPGNGPLQPTLFEAALPSLDAAVTSATTCQLRSSVRGLPPVCRAVGCASTIPLSSYQLRHRLCGEHLRALSFRLPGQPGEHRFCGKCNRAQLLSEFASDRRSCIKQLKLLSNARRLRRKRGAAAAGAQPLAPLLDVEEWPEEVIDDLLNADSSDMPLLFLPSSQLEEASGVGGSACEPLLPTWPVDLPSFATASLKLPGNASPAHSFPPAGLRAAAEAAAAPLGASALLAASIQPGCILLSLDFLLPPSAEAAWAAEGAAASFLARARPGPNWPLEAASSASLRLAGGGGGRAPAAEAPPEFELGQAAALCSEAAEVSLRPSLRLPAEAAVSVRLNGQLVSAALRVSPARDAAELALLAVYCQGCALVDLDAGGPARHCPATRALLLARDARLVSQVNASWAAQALRGPEGQRALWAIGAALAVGDRGRAAAALPPAARARLSAYGAAAAIRYGWPAGLAPSLAALASAAGEGAELGPGALGGASLMHQAAAEADGGAAVRAVRAGAPPSVRGSAATGDALGCTPLHLAAARGDAACLAALCEPGSEEGADAMVAFFSARDASGRTPASLAPAGAAAALAARLRDARAAAAAAVAAARPASLGVTHAAHVALLAEAGLARAPPAVAADAQALLRQVARAEEAARDRVAPARAADANESNASNASPLLRARAHGLRCSSVLLGAHSVICWPGLAVSPLPHAAVQAAMPHPSWRVWRRSPTAVCAGGLRGAQRARLLLFFASAALGFMPGRRAAIVRARAAVFVTTLLFLYELLAEPTWCSLATRVAFGAGAQQPWQGGIKQLFVTLLVSMVQNGTVPLPVYSAAMLLRGALPLAVRWAGEGRALALLRIRITGAPYWDAAHLLLCLACVAQQRRAARRVGVVKGKLD